MDFVPPKTIFLGGPVCRQDRRKPYQCPRQDPFLAHLLAYDVILLNQPWHDLFKRKQPQSLCSLYILILPLRPMQGPFQQPSTKKTLLRTIFFT